MFLLRAARVILAILLIGLFFRLVKQWRAWRARCRAAREALRR